MASAASRRHPYRMYSKTRYFAYSSALNPMQPFQHQRRGTQYQSHAVPHLSGSGQFCDHRRVRCMALQIRGMPSAWPPYRTTMPLCRRSRRVGSPAGATGDQLHLGGCADVRTSADGGALQRRDAAAQCAVLSTASRMVALSSSTWDGVARCSAPTMARSGYRPAGRVIHADTHPAFPAPGPGNLHDLALRTCRAGLAQLRGVSGASTTLER